MNRRLIAAAIAASTLALAACTANWKVSGSCDTTKKCSINGEISGTFGGPKGGGMQLRAAMLTASTVPDAAQFYIDVTGSTVDYPSTGTATLTLINSATNIVRASRSFAWVRAGSVIRLADPNAVNAWAAASGGDADKMSYRIDRFQSDYGVGDQTIAVATVYEGAVTSTATSTFYSCTPRGVYTRSICAQ